MTIRPFARGKFKTRTAYARIVSFPLCHLTLSSRVHRHHCPLVPYTHTRIPFGMNIKGILRGFRARVSCCFSFSFFFFFSFSSPFLTNDEDQIGVLRHREISRFNGLCLFVFFFFPIANSSRPLAPRADCNPNAFRVGELRTAYTLRVAANGRLKTFVRKDIE